VDGKTTFDVALTPMEGSLMHLLEQIWGRRIHNYMKGHSASHKPQGTSASPKVGKSER